MDEPDAARRSPAAVGFGCEQFLAATAIWATNADSRLRETRLLRVHARFRKFLTRVLYILPADALH